jgi:tRNA G10  N-methylase Trm11
MKKSLFLITTITLMFAFFVQSCDRSADNMERAEADLIEAERDLDIAQTEVEADVQIYRQETANDIRENNLAIADIKKKIQDEDPERRAALEVRIAELEGANSDLKREIDNYRVTNRDNWNDFKDQFSSSMDDLGSSLDNFFSRTTTSRN